MTSIKFMHFKRYSQVGERFPQFLGGKPDRHMSIED